MDEAGFGKKITAKQKAALKKEKYSIVLLVLILILASSFRLWRITDWPVSHDEAFDTFYAREMIQGKLPFYIQVAPQQGQMIGYVLAPAIYLFGNDIFFIRLSIVMISIFSILLLYLFVKKYYGNKVALFSAFILALTPNDILTSNLALEFSIINFFVILTLYLLQKYFESDKFRYLYILSFCSGLAVITRLSFLFFLLPFLLTIRIYPYPTLIYNKFANIKKLHLKQLFFLTVFFLLGSSPMIYWNLTNNFTTVTFILKNFPVTQENINLLDVPGNIKDGIAEFVKFLDTETREGLFYLFGRPHYFSIVLLLSSVIFIGIPLKDYYQNSKVKKHFENLRKNSYIFINFVLVLLLTITITLTTFRHGDLTIIFYFYAIIIAWSINFVADYFKRQKILVLCLVILFFVYNAGLFMENFNEKFMMIQRDGCDILFPEMAKYFRNSSSKIIFDTDTSYRAYYFYSPESNTDHLKARRGSFQDVYPKWEEYLNVTNVKYVFIKDECIIRWAKNSTVYNHFVSFLADFNKTLALEANVTVDGKELFKVFTITSA